MGPAATDLGRALGLLAWPLASRGLAYKEVVAKGDLAVTLPFMLYFSVLAQRNAHSRRYHRVKTRCAGSKSTLHIPIAALESLNSITDQPPRRYGGIPYMNEFRGVKQPIGLNFTTQSPLQRRFDLVARGMCQMRPGRRLRHAAGVQGRRFCIYSQRKSRLQCNISAVIALAQNPSIHRRKSLKKEA